MSYNDVGHLIISAINTLQHFATLHHIYTGYIYLPMQRGLNYVTFDHTECMNNQLLHWIKNTQFTV